MDLKAMILDYLRECGEEGDTYLALYMTIEPTPTQKEMERATGELQAEGKIRWNDDSGKLEVED